jgi:hypothetical protein
MMPNISGRNALVYIEEDLMRVRSLIAISVAAAWSCGAEDFWVSRPPETWSALEIKQMVNESPWAKLASVRMRSGLPTAPEILVRWDSAVPILEACSHGGMERHLFTCASKLWERNSTN